jgi:hypothetical protein
MYFPLQLLFTFIFSNKFIIYHYIHALRHEVRGPQTGKPLTGRLLVYAGRQGGDSLVFRAAKRLTRFESMGKCIFFTILLLILYLLFIYFLKFVIYINIYNNSLLYIYKIFFFNYFILFFDLCIFLTLLNFFLYFLIIYNLF